MKEISKAGKAMPDCAPFSTFCRSRVMLCSVTVSGKVSDIATLIGTPTYWSTATLPRIKCI